MKPLIAILALGLAAVPPPTEPPARHLTSTPLALPDAPAHISAVGEFPDGGLLVTDQNAPAIWFVAAGGPAMRKIGSEGGGEGQYIQPGGVYRGPGSTLLVLDRAQGRVLVVSAAGAIDRTYPIAVRGVTGGSDADVDRQHLDAHDLAYFEDRQAAMRAQFAGQMPTSLTVVRFDAVRQEKTPVVTDLRVPEEKSRSGGPGVTFSQQVIGSPADGWGVAPDGRAAVVRAKPYRVDWVSRDGKTTVGPVIAYDVLPMTDADRQARVAKARSEPSIGAGVGSDGSHPMVEKPALEFAATKPPFAAGDVLVSPDAMVWVRRTSPSDAADAIYDVFDASGRRTDRVAVAADEWVVGFGRGAIFVRAHGPRGTEVLRKYLIK